MTALPLLAADVFANCQRQAESLGDIFSQWTGNLVEVAVDDPLADAPLPDLSGPGLVLVLTTDEVSVALVLIEGERLLPPELLLDEAALPQKLAALGRGLAPKLLPEELTLLTATGILAPHLQAVLQQQGAPAELAHVTLRLQVGEISQTAMLAWPMGVRSPKSPSATDAGDAASTTDAAAAASNTLAGGLARALRPADAPSEPAARGSTEELGIGDLPPYCRSLLKISVPLSVKLAATRQKVSRILELAPGTLIQFKKPCDEMLELEVGGQTIAAGEAVKVGDKFGLRIASITLPEERFLSLGDWARRQAHRRG